MKRLLVVLAIGACGADEGGTQQNPDAGTSGDSNSCDTMISWEPFAPEASDLVPVRVSVNVVGSPGVFTYTWQVRHENLTITHTQESTDGREIGFIAADPGFYDVSVGISGGFTACPFASTTINVGAPGANANVYRLRASPRPSTQVPPQEQIIQVKGGANYVRDILLDPGVGAAGVVRNGVGGTGVTAYVKFMPVSLSNAFTELFTTSTGSYSTKLIGVTHDVLVIPTSTTLAPKLVQWTPTTTSLVVGPGTSVSGIVLDPSGAGLVGAKVQLIGNGVPSTLATTVTGGSFTLRADYPANATMFVKVTPPATSGLPRLEASSAQFVLGQAIQVNYAAALSTTCNLLNTPVRRSAANQAGAKVTVVGNLAGIAGTVSVGATTVNALGSVRVAATADGAGRLPAMFVPRSAQLSAAIELGMDDFAVEALDTSACSVASIDAPAQTVATGIAKNEANAPLGGVRVEASPLGVLALADAQTVATTTASNGAFSLPLAAGGRYDVRFIDPYGRAARLDASNVTAAGVPSNAVLPLALTISGKVSVSGSSQPLSGTSVQLLCAQCSGVDAARPVAETATNNLSQYRIAVPDPGLL